MRTTHLPIIALSFVLLSACGGGASDTFHALSTSTTSLVLAASGTTRVITVNNEGPLPAKNLRFSSTDLPTGTWVRSTCPADLLPLRSCVLIVTPGSVPSATPGDLAPGSGSVELAADNTTKVQVKLSVITHGSVYQGGYVFAIDDTTPIANGVGGKVLDLLETGPSRWYHFRSAVAGINEDSTAGPDSCDGALDGRCNTQRIMARYRTDARDFAAALCVDSRNGGFADWYLPATCETGYHPAVSGSGVCGSQAAPRLPDNVKSRLFDKGLGGLTGYWTSTQASATPLDNAYIALFTPDIANLVAIKQLASFASRCARHLTP